MLALLVASHLHRKERSLEVYPVQCSGEQTHNLYWKAEPFVPTPPQTHFLSLFNTSSSFSQSISCLQALLTKKQGQSPNVLAKKERLGLLLERRWFLNLGKWVMLPHSQAEFPMATVSRLAGNQFNS